MAKLQETLDSLQPYVIGIRYLEGTPLVDAVFKEGWTVPEDPTIKKIKGNEELNYYMIFSEVENIGIDEILEYVRKTIKLNEEREKKHALLKIKFEELKEVFKRTSLTKLNRLKFVFPEEDLLPELSDFDIETKTETVLQKPIETKIDIPLEEKEIMTPLVDSNTMSENLNLTDEDREILEEEERAKRNLAFLKNKNVNKILTPKIELPPKKKIELVTTNYDSDCECSPEEACEKCIDKKDF